MADLPFISKSDLEIFKALTVATDLNKKDSSNPMQTSSDKQATQTSDVFFSCNTNSQAISTLPSISDNTDSQTISTFESASEDFISEYSSFKFDSEYETVGHDINCINKMCDLFIEKNKHLEMQILSFLKEASSNHKEIISPKYLYEMLEKTNITVEHVVLICDKMYKIQQLLQERRYERILKVNPSCQKAVLKFFNIANEIMNKLQQHMENMENYSIKNATKIETRHEELKSNFHKRILELAKRLHIISQFRDQLQTSTESSVSKYKLDLLLS